MRTITILIACCILIGCTERKESKKSKPCPEAANTTLPAAPKNIVDSIMAAFPDAMPVRTDSDLLLKHLKTKFGISAQEILLGASTCVDDIIYIKNFHAHPEIKGPFHLGGLAGLKAFAHHVPEGGTMLLVIAAHIGIDENGKWGYILRPEQHLSSSCCGALMGTLEQLKKGVRKPITEEDYQSDKILELANKHRDKILNSKNPIIELTRITSLEAERQIKEHVLDVNLEHTKYIILVTGVLINTDYKFTDYQSINHIVVYDVAKKAFVEDLKHL